MGRDYESATYQDKIFVSCSLPVKPYAVTW